jgi:uncharacterized membrane protein YbhN (UPF0104 family)
MEAPTADAQTRRRVNLRALVGLLVSLVSLTAFVWWASRQDAPKFPTEAEDWALLVAAVGVYGLATLARSWRWHEIMKRADVGHRRADAFALVPVGYMGNTVLPARGGELLRIFLLAGRADARRREVLGTIIGERLLDAGSLIVLFVILTAAHVAGNPAGDRPAWLAGGALVLGLLALWYYLRLRRRGRLERFAATVRPVARAARPLVGPLGVVLGVVTLVVWLMEGLIFYLVGHSLNLDISLLEGCFVLVLSAFFSLIPAAPGYVGTFEAAVVFGLDALAITGGSALAFALLVRFVLFFPITLVGLILLVSRYGGLRQLYRQSEEAAHHR